MTARRDTPPVKQQLVDSLKKSNHILLVGPVVFDVDILSSFVALASILEKAGKKVTKVFVGNISEDHKKVFDIVDDFQKDYSFSGDVIIRINKNAEDIGKLRYIKNENGSLDLVMTPKNGTIDKKDISIEIGSAAPDLCLMVGVDRLEDTGLVPNQLKQIMAMPVASIGVNRQKRDFAQIDFYDMHSTTIAEVIPAIVESWDKDLLDSSTASRLYAGLSHATGFFQNEKTTPKLLTVAAQLLALSAKLTKKPVHQADKKANKPLDRGIVAHLQKEGSNGTINSKVQIDSARVEKSHDLLTEDELYAPVVSDLEQHNPVISDFNGGPGLLAGLLRNKKTESDKSIDFNQLEQSLRPSDSHDGQAKEEDYDIDQY